MTRDRGVSGAADVQMLAALLAPMLGIARPELAPLDAATWHALATLALRQRLGPLLYTALQRAPRADAPAAVHGQLAQAHCRSAAAALYQQQELAALLRHCAAVRIPCIVLKGSALAATLYPDPALRPCGDLDLLFRPADIPAVVQHLVAAGYVSHTGYKPGVRLPNESSEYHLSRYGLRPAIVEPHWHITSDPYYMRRIPVSWCWEETAPATVAGVSTQVLTSSALFLHLVSHYYLHHRGRHLLWSFDIALLLARHAVTWDWDALSVQVERFGLGLFVGKALALVEQVWGVAPPSGCTAALDRIRPDFGERVADWVVQHPDTSIWMIWQAKQTSSTGQRLNLLAKIVLPAPAGLRCLAQRHERRQVVRGYLRRIWRFPGALYALSRALWRLR